MAFTFDGFTFDNRADDDDLEDEEAFLPSHYPQHTSANAHSSSTSLNDFSALDAYARSGAAADASAGGEDEEALNDGEALATETNIPKMPADFYGAVDVFLSRSPPRLKGKKRLDVEASAAIGKIDRRQPPAISSSSSGTGKPNLSKSNSKSASGPRGQFDTSLLNEAFAYTDKLLREAVLDDAMESSSSARQRQSQQQQQQQQQQSRSNSGRGGSAGSAMPSAHLSRNPYSDSGNPKSAPSSSSSGIGGKGGSAKSSSAAKERTGAGLVKRLRSQTNVVANGSTSGFDLSSAHSLNVSDEAVRKSEFDSLVLNFEQGLTLRKLKAELAQSQQSMRKSEHMMRDLTGKGFSLK